MVDPIYQHLGSAVRQRRCEVGMTQSALASHLGLSRTSVTNIECGRQPMLIHQLLQVGRVLDLDLPELVRRLQAMQPKAEGDATEMFERLLASLQAADGEGA